MTMIKGLIFVFLHIVNNLGYLPEILGDPKETGIGSQYGQPGDALAQQTLACAPDRHIDSAMHVCAHRWLPCGTILIIENVRNQQLSWCAVMDRGPYGALVKNDDSGYDWVIKITPSDPGKWRGILDMSPAVVHDMGHNGFELINYWVAIGPHHPIRKFITII